MPDQKINVSSKFAIKNYSVLPLLMLNLEVLSLSIHSLKMFVPYASEIWTKSYSPNYKKNNVFLQSFFKRVDAILEDVSVAKIIF